MYTFKLPDIGEGVSEGEIVKWHVKEGDEIRKEQDMVEIMTDKVTVRIPSPVAGRITKIIFPEGEVVKVGEGLIEIATAEGGAEDNSEKVVESAPSPKVPVHASEPRDRSAERPLASPAVRRIAMESGIELSNVKGSGENGRITLEDLDAYKKQTKAGREDKRSIPLEVPIAPVSEQDEILEPRGLRRLIFEKMTKSKAIIPHFTVMESADVSEILHAVDALKEKGSKITLTSFFIKAATVALKEYPYLNAIYDEENRRYILRKEYNIGMAIDTQDGLTVAVVHNADRLSLSGIADKVRDLATRARSSSLGLGDVQNGTFTVTNIGTIGGVVSTPIINFPEVAILGVHRTFKQMDSTGKQRSVMYLSLSCDHRLIDGAMATRFIMRIKELIENPLLILV
ncbi:dihydrolipoamide acetyltransferase family protein [Oxyplasma meridianum]|uniref:dihydrolipoyllysine-residue (2-methylpropanoyl)transferase n=1 Tax=Oxyplasma meridianum TaxID=3073602 RepID=A0AAX4NJ85_9ARCH